MKSYIEAQRNYDRQLPPEAIDSIDDDFPPDPFCDSDITEFIKHFSESTEEAAYWMACNGIVEEPRCAELLRKLCKAWMKNEEIVYAVVGTQFWEDIKNFAHEYWYYNTIEQRK